MTVIGVGDLQLADGRRGMSGGSETLAEIVAEMRGMGNYQRYSGDHAHALADRIDAAAKRAEQTYLDQIRDIKFSHNYPKLHGQTSADLLAVRPIRIDKSTPDELLEYDTTYYAKAREGCFAWDEEKARFPLPTGDYIQLIFLGNLRIPFCTIRKNYPPQKSDYYQGKIGDVFDIEIKEEAK